jgi:hypothetical protein
LKNSLSVLLSFFQGILPFQRPPPCSILSSFL